MGEATTCGDDGDDDRSRPGYPDAVVDLIVDGDPSLVVEAGCGTGDTARLVAARGVAVLGVEPHAGRAEVARSHGIDVTVTSFERWEPVTCDTVYAAQTWHWIDPTLGAEVAARAVRPGGRWLAFWNVEHDAALAATCDSVYRAVAPDLLDARPFAQLVAANGFRQAIGTPIEMTGAFHRVRVDEVPWVERLTAADLARRIDATSAHRLLDDDVRRRVHDELLRRLGEPGDVIEVAYRTHLFHADRIDHRSATRHG